MTAAAHRCEQNKFTKHPVQNTDSSFGWLDIMESTLSCRFSVFFWFCARSLDVSLLLQNTAHTIKFRQVTRKNFLHLFFRGCGTASERFEWSWGYRKWMENTELLSGSTKSQYKTLLLVTKTRSLQVRNTIFGFLFL